MEMEERKRGEMSISYRPRMLFL